MTTANVELKRFLEVDLTRFLLVFGVETKANDAGDKERGSVERKGVKF